MAVAARTAPKTKGVDNVEIFAIEDEATKRKLIDKMREIGRLEKKPSSERDADSIASSPVIVVVGVKFNPAGLNCGFCGCETCEALRKTSGTCAFNSMDLGIAAGSAVSAAADLRVDNRIMYSIGRACIKLGLFSGEVKQALGVPLSISGKNPFFDRKC
jgi:uncharacterized ferredoxin-like protein